MERFDAIVLGTGGVGSAALYQLARRGLRVLGIDRFNPPHERGSTHGHTRVIRQAYFEHPDYVPLLVESYRLWHELVEQVGQKLFYRVGLIQIGPADGHVVPGVLRSAREHKLVVEELAAAAIECRWPGLRAPEDAIGVFEPAAGYLLVENCVRAHLDAARHAGARVLTDTEVLAWTSSEREVRVQTSAGEFTAAKLVIAAGSWSGKTLLPLTPGEDLGECEPAQSPYPNPLPQGEGIPKLNLRRKSLFWFAADTDRYDVTAGFPVFLFELPEGVFYGFPKIDARGVKIAEHSGGHVVEDPLTVDRSVDADESRRVVNFLSRYLPEVSQTQTHHTVCLYTMSPDENFIVDRHPRHANVVFAAGLSGHGFKFVPVLGRALAELALDGATELPIDFLSLQRFERAT
jgi:glycine/D-amino acid oxidase-like deaminating enzyme